MEYPFTFVVGYPLMRHLAFVRWFGKSKRPGYFAYYQACKPGLLAAANVMLVPVSYKPPDCPVCIELLARSEAKEAAAE